MGIIRSLKRALRSTQEYEDAVTTSIQSGPMDNNRWRTAHAIANKLDMTPQERAAAHIRILQSLMARSMADGYVDENELKVLDRALAELRIDFSHLDAGVTNSFRQVLALQQIAGGVLPVLDPGYVPVALRGNERGHLVTSVRIVEERITRQRFSAGHSGFSFRICKGVSYRIGGSRGVSFPVTSSVVTSTGPLTLTSERAVYLGSKKGFTKPWAKVVAVEPFSNAVTFHFSDRQNPTTLMYDDTNIAPIVEAICAQLLR